MLERISMDVEILECTKFSESRYSQQDDKIRRNGVSQLMKRKQFQYSLKIAALINWVNLLHVLLNISKKKGLTS